MFRGYYCLSLLLLFSPLVIAQDMVNASPTGNITVEKTKDLVMEKEVLRITHFNTKSRVQYPVTIDVNFQIKNVSDKDIVRKVAFLLPPVYCCEDKNESWKGFEPNDEKTNFDAPFRDFSTFINGRLQLIHERIEAFQRKRNITEELNELGLPLNPCDVFLDGAINPKYEKVLMENHLLSKFGKPVWYMQEFYEWLQTFQADRTVDIHHIYVTSTGGSILGLRTAAQLNAFFIKQNPPLESIWNHDIDSLLTSHPVITKEVDKKPYFCVGRKWVHYQLITDTKWPGGIHHFTLIIRDRSGMPFAVNPFYGDDQVWRHDDNHTSTFVLKDFFPYQNIYIQFLTAPQTLAEKEICKSAMK